MKEQHKLKLVIDYRARSDKTKGMRKPLPADGFILWVGSLQYAPARISAVADTLKVENLACSILEENYLLITQRIYQ